MALRATPTGNRAFGRPEPEPDAREFLFSAVLSTCNTEALFDSRG